MKLTILGDVGRTGKYLVEQALAAGHEVTACMRSEEKLDLASPKLHIQVGDARSAADLANAPTVQDVINSAIGSNKPGDDLIVQSTKALLEAMHQTGVRRVIMMS